MIRHLLKLVWNRKKVNFLIMIEIFFSFIVVFAVIFMSVYAYDNYRRPLGFKYENIWAIKVQASQDSGEDHEKLLASLRAMTAATREFSEVETAAAMWSAPYGSADWTTGRKTRDGRNLDIGLNVATDELKDLFGLKIIRGRWFSREDDGITNYLPVVISRAVAEGLFGDEDPIGRNVAEPEPGNRNPKEARVIGVFEDFRNRGEFSENRGYMFYRHDLQHVGEMLPLTIVAKVRPGTTADFEETLLRRLQAEARDLSLEIKPLTDRRTQNLQEYLVPMAAFGMVAGFLLLMVALGLTGVLWLNVTQRTKEIGLRRAKGATRQRIYRQIIGEVLIIAGFGVAIGTLVVIQFPLLDLLGFVDPMIFIRAIVISALVIFILALISGIYPSRLATKVTPVEALHYE
ncbi:MAG: ABC transporter permease [Blastocatellales bacterium]